MAPHGVYPAAGQDKWIAVACRDDADWRNLADAVGRPELSGDPRFASASERLKRRDELDALVARWTREREARDAEALLQARGVPAHEVQNSAEAWRDPHLRRRGHFVELPHPTHGTTTVEGPRTKLSRTPAQVRAAAPTIGQHNQYVLERILGYGEEKITELVAAGVLG